MAASPAYYSDGPEALIVSLAMHGDRQAFAELVRRRQSSVRTFMRRSCNDAALADDLAQQVFLQMWRKLRQLKEPEKFGPWLQRLSINQLLQHQRKQDPLYLADDDTELPAINQDRPDIAMDLDAALASLPAAVRLCIVLSYHERLAHREISDLTGIAIGTVKSHIRRGSERLRELLAAYGEKS